MITYQEFEFNSSSFTSNELKAIELMKEMLQICGEIFSKQFDSTRNVSTFYPEELSKDQILSAAQENPAITNPYTIVKRSGDNLMVVPYCIEYAQELKKIKDIAIKAADLIEEPNLKGYLIRLAKACEDDSWDDLENYWLTITGNKLDLQLAPIEGYLDEKLNIKHAFQGTLRVYSDSDLYNPSGYIETVKAINFSALHEDNKVNAEFVIRVDDIIASGGNSAADPSISSNYPNDPEKVKAYGTKILIYANNVVSRQRSTLLPILNKVIKPSILEKYTEDEYFASFVRNLMVHEVAEAFIKYSDSAKRLKDMNLPIQELHSSVVGLKLAAHHVLQGALSAKDYEAMLLTAFIGRGLFYFYKNEKNYSPNLVHYIKGYTLALNYMKEKGALMIDQDTGLMDIDYPRAFACMDELAKELDEIKAHGTDKEAASLFAKYENYSIYEQFRHKLNA
jgi:hypothetical protein